jgi:hypothetical protein
MVSEVLAVAIAKMPPKRSAPRAQFYSSVAIRRSRFKSHTESGVAYLKMIAKRFLTAAVSHD